MTIKEKFEAEVAAAEKALAEAKAKLAGLPVEFHSVEASVFAKIADFFAAHGL
jgi:multidrug resistance efflux pump